MIRTGDIVLHKPSGEEWLVAFCKDGEVCPCGWPLGYAKASDCEIVKKATDDESVKLLHELADMKADDPRRSYARQWQASVFSTMQMQATG